MSGARAEQITGLVLAGGRGRRVGGADEGWASYRGRDARPFRSINSAADAEGRVA
jgi:hypothetical protein